MDLFLKIDNKEYKLQAELVGAPTPTGKYVMLNCINWASFDNLPILDASELTNFVYLVSGAGVILGGNSTIENKLVSDVHAKGKKVTFSIAGGTQSVADITAAVTTNRTAFINNIANKITQYNYDGIAVDIENTNLNSQVMPDFLNALRAKLDTIKPNLRIGVYTQPYQLNTVWAKIAEAKNAITWLSPMLYDYPNSVEQIKTTTQPWVDRVGKEKILLGAAVNYDASGFDLNEWSRALDIVNTEGWQGVGIWQNQLYTQPYRDITKSKFGTIV